MGKDAYVAAMKADALAMRRNAQDSSAWLRRPRRVDLNVGCVGAWAVLGVESTVHSIFGTRDLETRPNNESILDLG